MDLFNNNNNQTSVDNNSNNDFIIPSYIPELKEYIPLVTTLLEFTKSSVYIYMLLFYL